MAAKPQFYLTTAIDYPNGSPHLGHAFEKIVTDCYSRWYRFLGYETYFVTGTDENGQKLSKSAEAAGQPTQAYVDKQVEGFRKLCKDLEITHDDFIRTTEERHRSTAQAIWTTLEKAGDIYFDRYSGKYCFGCENFYPDNQIVDGKCPEHGTALEFIEEDGFFFKMSRYQDWIVKHIESHPEFIFPTSARGEILSRLKGDPLKDLSISRPNAGWGIACPSNDQYVMYTWFDALINYYAAVKGGEAERFWPADMHVIGKDITWFHAVIWPIMLHAAGIELPKQIHVHGMVLAGDGRKMSKSLGNGVDPYDVIGKYPLDSFRYYLLKFIPSGKDGRFSVEELVAKHNDELANDFGNLVMRILKLAKKRLGDAVSGEGIEKPAFDFVPVGEKVCALMNSREHHKALEVIWEKVREVNGYINDEAPWKLKDDTEKLRGVAYQSFYAIHCLATLLSPFLPNTGKNTLEMLGTFNEGLDGLRFGKHSFQLGEPVILFPKIELN